MDKINVKKVYVLHVKNGFENRKESILKQMKHHNIEFEFMLDADMDVIGQEHLEKYFSGDMKKISPTTSCALKHLFVYEQMVTNKYENALILEDDIILDKSFNTIFNLSVAEIKTRSDIKKDRIFISYENSGLKYVPRKQLIKNQYLYIAKSGRCAGAYYISNYAAYFILDFIKKQKCSVPIDWYHNFILENSDIEMYWCHPTIAEQSSHNGITNSSLDHKPQSYFRNLRWKVKKIIKQKFYCY